jgi:cellobiose-specific phosphotransferase system component IIB
MKKYKIIKKGTKIELTPDIVLVNPGVKNIAKELKKVIKNYRTRDEVEEMIWMAWTE